MKKKSYAFVGPPVCGGPVRPNMLNMPKSASEYISISTALRDKYIHLP